MTEADQIRLRYARRHPRLETEGDRRILEERLGAIREIMRLARFDVKRARVLDLGCGSGRVLRSLVDHFGFEVANLTGLDLIDERVNTARGLVSGAAFICGDVATFPFGAGSADLILMFTMLSSVLDSPYRKQITESAWRALAPGGMVLVYDMRMPSPSNRDVRPVGLRELRRLFSHGVVRSRSLTVAPPLARALPRIYSFLSRCPWLRTHRLSSITKSD